MQLQIELNDVRKVINGTHNWKTPGPDQIQNFWYKRLTYTHTYLTDILNNLIKDTNETPKFLTQGITYLKPKDANDTKDPAKYRPLTCLQTIYKIFTGVISTKIKQHCYNNNIITENQKGCKQNSQGCKEQLIIDSVILGQAKQKNRNMYLTYIDYKKAYDSIPHDWLIHVLNIYKINPTIITFMEALMSKWSTKLQIQTSNNIHTSSDIPIKCGIFQGDTLSPLWFCLALNPLSNVLNDSKYGFNLKYNNETIKCSHSMYMDDIKLYASNKKQLEALIKTTDRITRDINMEFGFDKCKSISINRGKRVMENFELDGGGIIAAMKEEDIYKYLGIEQNKIIQQGTAKERIKQTFKNRIDLIARTYLNSHNLTKAISTFAIPVLTYSFGIIHWSQTDLENLQRLVRTTLTKHRKHHPKSCTERTILPRALGGKGLIDIKNMHNKQIHNLRQYFYIKAQSSQIHQAIVQADTDITPLKLKQQNYHLEQKDNLHKLNIMETKSSSWTSS